MYVPQDTNQLQGGKSRSPAEKQGTLRSPRKQCSMPSDAASDLVGLQTLRTRRTRHFGGVPGKALGTFHHEEALRPPAGPPRK